MNIDYSIAAVHFLDLWCSVCEWIIHSLMTAHWILLQQME